MDKDNLNTRKNRYNRKLFASLTTQGLESLLGETHQQTLTAFLLMLLGLFLAVAGFVAVILKLARLINVQVFLAIRRMRKTSKVNPEFTHDQLQALSMDRQFLARRFLDQHYFLIQARDAQTNLALNDFTQRQTNLTQ